MIRLHHGYISIFRSKNHGTGPWPEAPCAVCQASTVLMELLYVIKLGRIEAMALGALFPYGFLVHRAHRAVHPSLVFSGAQREKGGPFNVGGIRSDSTSHPRDSHGMIRRPPIIDHLLHRM